MSKKDFTYTIKTKTGILLVQEIVTFGSDDHPVPENWSTSNVMNSALSEWYREFPFRALDISYRESEPEDYTKVFTEEEIKERALSKLSEHERKLLGL